MKGKKRKPEQLIKKLREADQKLAAGKILARPRRQTLCNSVVFFNASKT